MRTVPYQKVTLTFDFKPNFTLYSMFYDEACNEFAGPSPRHCDRTTQLLLNKSYLFIYLPSDVISQEKKLQLPLGLSPKHRNMQFL